MGRLLHPVLMLVGAVVMLGGSTACTPGGATDGPRLGFRERSHDFGQVSSSQKTEYRFALTNTGSRPLEIGEIRPEPASPGG